MEGASDDAVKVADGFAGEALAEEKGAEGEQYPSQDEWIADGVNGLRSDVPVAVFDKNGLLSDSEQKERAGDVAEGKADEESGQACQPAFLVREEALLRGGRQGDVAAGPA